MSVAILAQAISCSNVRGVFSVLVQVSTTQFCSFSTLSHATCERPNRCARISGTSRLFEYLVLLTVLSLTLMGRDFAPVQWIPSRRFPKQWLRMMQKITNIEQFVSSLAARVTALETNATSVSSGSGDGSTAAGSFGSHGQGSSDDSRNTRRRLGTFSSPEDEHARSAVLLRFPCEQYRTGITNWISNLWENQTFQSVINPSEFIAKQVPCQSDSYLNQVSSVRTLWPNMNKMVFPLKLTVLSETPKQLSRSANPSHLKTGKSESNLRLCGECWQISSKFSSLMEMTKVQFIVPALDARSQVLSIKDRRKGVGKPVFKLAPFGSGQLFALVAPDLCVPSVPGEVLQKVISQASTANV